LNSPPVADFERGLFGGSSCACLRRFGFVAEIHAPASGFGSLQKALGLQIALSMATAFFSAATACSYSASLIQNHAEFRLILAVVGLSLTACCRDFKRSRVFV
jgi:hypothetical protein